MRIALAVLMLLHGLAHLPGVVGSWRLAPLEGMPYKTTLLAGHVDVGDAGMRVMGLVWLLTALGFVASAAGAFADRSWWTSAAVALALVSLTVSALEWPAARIGVFVNLALLAALLLGARFGWLGSAA
ncbi:MAG TPA: hypothetical protein VFS40_01510 [Gemmatimonadales bacterium]|nr:hypothetical protein [Gemmatimonadales bacterium]